jgi:hypothetical protein
LTARLALLALCVAGCNAVFDIRDTAPVETVRDTDGDGLLDNIDNCIDVPNVGQEESDGDALGDACDRCPGVLGDSDHDEDGDQRPDACDDCPGLDDFDDSDGDGDGVGDACDFDSHLTERLRFDPFVTLDETWQGSGLWEVSSDDSLESLEPVAADARGRSRPDLSVSSTEWSVRLGVLSSQSWVGPDRAGIVMVGPTSAVTSCTIECRDRDSGCMLSLVIDGVSVREAQLQPRPSVALRLEMKLANPGTDLRAFTCETAEHLTVTANLIPGELAWTPGVLAGQTMRVSYVDIVQ